MNVDNKAFKAQNHYLLTLSTLCENGQPAGPECRQVQADVQINGLPFACRPFK